MNRRTTIFCGSLLLLAPFLAAQQQPQNPARLPSPEDALTSTQLVLWTWMQKPQPTPQPLPPPDKSIPPSDQQPAQSANPQGQHHPAKQIFIGKIVKDKDRLVLRTSEGTYQLDEQGNVSQYEGQSVRISGTLDTASNTIHVAKIELLS